MFTNVDTIRQIGFTGFKKVADLWRDHSGIPSERGVYVIINPDCSKKDFLSTGVGGFFKGKNPNVTISELEMKWVNDCHVLYIGQAGGNGSSSTLRKRLKQYLDFGQGKPVGHYGGRLIWQVKHHSELIVAWKVTGSGNPSLVESQLLQDFQNYFGRLPFANLRM